MVDRFDSNHQIHELGNTELERRTSGISRRNFIKNTGSAAAAATAAWALPGAGMALPRDHHRYNILMIVTDQERHLQPHERPSGYRLPGQEMLATRGVVFETAVAASTADSGGVHRLPKPSGASVEAPFAFAASSSFSNIAICGVAALISSGLIVGAEAHPPSVVTSSNMKTEIPDVRNRFREWLGGM